MVKRCRWCDQEKPLDDFYARQNKCKDCTKRSVTQHRLANIERVRAYDRTRALLPHRVANAVRVTRAWRTQHRDRAKAQQVANYAMRRGVLVKPDTCQECGRENRWLNKHYHDYSHPLAVIWLCKPCHVVADKIRRRLEAS